MTKTLPFLIWLAGAPTVWALVFTPENIIGMIGALGILVTAIAAAIGVVIKSISGMREDLRKGKEETTAKIAEVSAKTDVIVGHVNSAATAATKKIDGLEQKVALLLDMLAEKKETAALLAQAVATEKSGPTAIANGAVVQGKSPAESLHEIDQNTAATAKNTARTDHTVQELKDKS